MPRILKKNKARLSNEEIEAAFLKKVGPSGIVAVYFYYKPSAKSRSSGDILSAALNQKRQSNGDNIIKHRDFKDDIHDHGGN